MKMDRNILFAILESRIVPLCDEGRLPEGFDYDTVMFLLRLVVFLDPTKGCRIKGSLNDWKGLPDSKTLFNYGRYVDDSYIIHSSKETLLSALPTIEDFLWSHLRLRLNRRKVKIFSCKKGIPFLGAIVSPCGCAITRRNMRRIKRNYLNVLCLETSHFSLQFVENSYKGYMSHFNVKCKMFQK